MKNDSPGIFVIFILIFIAIFVLNKITALIFQIIYIRNKTLDPCVNGQQRSWKKGLKCLNSSPIFFYFLKTSRKLGYGMLHGKAIWKPGIAEIVKATRGFAPGPHKWDLQYLLEHEAARANVLTHVGLWPMIIKLNSSWKMEVSKSAWIKSCHWPSC